MSDIPKARIIIAAVSGELLANGRGDLALRLRAALRLLHRRPLSRPKAPVESRPVDPETAARIRHYARAHPAISQQAIGEAFGVNHGRVAECLRGQR